MQKRYISPLTSFILNNTALREAMHNSLPKHRVNNRSKRPHSPHRTCNFPFPTGRPRGKGNIIPYPATHGIS